MAPLSRGGSEMNSLRTKLSPNPVSANTRDIKVETSPTESTATISTSEVTSQDDDAEGAAELAFSSSSESSSDNNSITSQNRLHDRLYGHRNASRSHSNLPPFSSQLFPPFYNRPPTPLPPSPSLTSLLRPSLSRHTSHPTTPDTSDAESISQAGTSGTNATTAAAGIAKSALTATTVPSASPKVPTYEYYGFALYLASSATFILYLLWAFLPKPFLDNLGIYYYPSRWWALAIPAWLVVCVIWIYAALGSYNTGHLTLPMHSVENIVDMAAHIAIIDREGKIIRRKRGGRHNEGYEGKHNKKGGKAGRHGRHNSGTGSTAAKSVYGAQGPMPRDFEWKRPWDEGTDAVMDVPIGAVNQILYGTGSIHA